jgi:uncharacterized protein YbaA (DUF1428 family)
MSYTEGFVIPVPNGNREAYRAMAAKAAPVFIEYGALRVVETWGDDIKPGKVNDFRTAVIATEGEGVVFSWIEWPSKEIRNAAVEKIMNDERMQPDGDLPFSGDRAIIGGFVTLLDEKA